MMPTGLDREVQSDFLSGQNKAKRLTLEIVTNREKQNHDASG
ncbi:hypothetical protein AQUSIP_14930 [Aquicella siphonis]|uniref:Uncharacterized protein n=1 Tax=Aquicella siphonis TaxID=254247 RepID=A0A5E4PIC4_9COXI|nr:hypothetical protein [Aquicella siphonis]VVC76187.1 hypothetical protein AQUSIP_14930 [Aquicella siphonis]